MQFNLYILRPKAKAWTRIATYKCGTTDEAMKKAIKELEQTRDSWIGNGGPEYATASYKITPDSSWPSETPQEPQEPKGVMRVGGEKK